MDLGTSSPEMEGTVYSRYLAVRSALPDAPLTAVLHIGARQTGVAIGDRRAATRVVVLEIGSQAIADDYFKHLPATALELENAIVVVEDEIARTRSMLPSDVALHTADTALGEIARLAGVTENATMVVSRDAVEQTFERLAAVALGRPAARSGLPTDNEFAARLLILRELMHHLQFSTITCHRAA